MMMIKKLLLTLGLILALNSHSFAMGDYGFMPSFGARMGADFGFTKWNTNALPPRLAGGVFFEDSVYWSALDPLFISIGTNIHFSTLAKTTIEIDQSPITFQWHEFSADIMLKLQLVHILYVRVGGGAVLNTPAKIIKGDNSLIGETRSSIQPIITWEVGGNFPLFLAEISHGDFIALNIAVRGAVNPMARKLDLHHFSSIHSVGVYLGISIIPFSFST